MVAASPSATLWDEGLNTFLEDLRSRGTPKNVIDGFLADKATAEETRRSAQSLQADTGKKYGGVEVAGKKVPGKWIAAIMDNIGRFVQIGDYAMKGAPETVGLAWWAIKQVLGGIQNNYKLYGFFGGALSDITEMMVVIRTYDKLYDERGDSSWKASDMVAELFKQIRNVYSAILDFSFSVKQHITAGKMSRIGHAIKDALGSSSEEFEGKMSSIRALKTKILESAQAAFQQKTFVKFDEVQEAINIVVQGQESSSKIQQAIQQSMEDLAKQTKPKSRDDYAKAEFDKNKIKLNPLPDSADTYDSYRNLRQHGTCEWIFSSPEYESWRISSTSSMLCVEGEHGVGKSVALAAIANHLENELSQGTDNILQYVSCESLQNSNASDARTDSSLSKDRVQKTIVYGVYNFVNTIYEGNTTILEKCNDVFKNTKSKKNSASTMTAKQKGEDLPEFDEALESLAQALDKKIILIIDAVDLISDQEEEGFANALLDLLKIEGLQVRIIVSSFSGSKFYSSLDKNGTPHLSVSDHNRSDIESTLKAKLISLPGWSDAEKEEAQKAVLEKTGSDFKYAVHVAIPFLEEPWQRPLSNRLKQLPGGLEETYSKAISQMAPNYRELLKTAVRYTLLANGPVTVTEVMDAHLGTYLSDSSDAGDGIIREESALYREQIRTAGGPFLDCQRTDNESIVKLKDPAAARRFFLHEPKTEEEDHKDSHICDNCTIGIAAANDYSISEKIGHLTIATALLKSLNSRTFQRRFLPVEYDEDGDEVAEEVKEDQETENSDTAKPESNPLTEANLAENTAKEGDETGGKVGENTEDDGSLDSIDYPYSEPEDDTPTTLDNTTQTRYEIRNWWSHIQKAEVLWPDKEERKTSKEWIIILEELDKFTSNKKVFTGWRENLFPFPFAVGWGPLHIAAQCNLYSLAAMLVGKGGDVMEVSEAGYTPLHNAAHRESLDMLTLFLEHGGNPNFETALSTPFQYWLLLHCTAEHIQKLFEHGASTTQKNEEDSTVIHYLASVGTEPEIFELLMDHEDANGQKVDINARNVVGETALHTLMGRRDVPLKLLQAFIDRGADVNIEDDDSQRPLFEAAWEGELEAMKVMIEKVTDIDDDDSWGRTALHNAAWQGKIEVVKFLIEHGASTLTVDKHDRTPFFFACLGKSEETARFLLDKMIEQGKPIQEINKKTKTGRTPLRQASAKGFTGIVEVLLNKIDDLQVVSAVDTRKGRNALHCASFRAKKEGMELLLKKGSDPTLKDIDGKTALQLCHGEWAVQGSNTFEDAISLLIDHDPVSAAHDSVLAATAAVNGSKRILEKLVSAKADLDTIDRYGWTPLLLARQFQHKEAEEFLSAMTQPTKWDVTGFEDDKIAAWEEGVGLELISNEDEEHFSITANRPISSGVTKYYFEITLLEVEDGLANPEIAIGFCTVSDRSLLEFPGWPMAKAASSKSWAYHGDNGGFYSFIAYDAQHTGQPYGPGDTVGCGVDFATGKIWYTMNGEVIKGGFDKVAGRLFPVVGLSDRVKIKANFRGDFVWKEGEMGVVEAELK